MISEPYVFISYARADHVVVDQIVAGLELAGFRTWRDTSEIKPGDNWASAIEDALVNASAYIYVSSAATQHSKWIEYELQLALTQKISPTSSSSKLIIPVVIDSHGKVNLPAFLSAFQWIDLESDVDKGIEVLIDELAKNLKVGAKQTPAPAINKGYAFISYAVEDSEFLEGLKEFLKEHEYTYWDFHESKRDYGTQFHLELEGIIRGSEAVLAILSPDWKKSRWTSREFLFSEDILKPIFLLRARELEPTLLISGLTYIDFVNDSTVGFAELDRELRRKGL